MRNALRTPTILLCIGLLGGCSSLTNLWDRIVGSPTEASPDQRASSIPAVVVGTPAPIPPAAPRAGTASTAPVQTMTPPIRSQESLATALSTPPVPTPEAADRANAVPSASAPRAGMDSAMAEADRTVYFDFDSSVIREEARAVIESYARKLAADRTLKVTVEGHADERGGREYNLSLGQKRAEAVLQALVMLGADELQLEAISFGEERPVVQGSDESSWARNRRAELKERR